MKLLYTALLAGFATMGLSLELTFYDQKDCLGDGAEDPDTGLYRIYRLANPDVGLVAEECQDLQTVGDEWTCSEYTDGGATGPIDCGPGHLDAWSIDQDLTSDDPNIKYECSWWPGKDCSGAINSGGEARCIGPWGNAGGLTTGSFQCDQIPVSGARV